MTAGDLHAAALRLYKPPEPTRLPAPEDWPVMPDTAYHGLAGDIVRACTPHTEADPVAVLASVLVAFGNAAGSAPHAVADFAVHPARLNVCLVGRSAKARKGTSWRVAATVLKPADPGWYKHRIKSGLSSGEGLVAAVKDPDIGESGEPVDGTGVADKRLLALEEEFARVLQVSKREASTLSAIVRTAYDSGDLSVLTKQALTATGAHISILGHITIDELRARLTDTDIANGFANRFLYLAVRREKLIADSRPADPNVMTALSRRVADALDTARHTREMARTEAAAGLWAGLYEQMAADDTPGVVGSLCARPEAHTLRLSIVYALLDRSPVVDTAHLRAAWAVWSYCRASTAHIFAADDTAGLTREAAKLHQALKAAGAAGLDGTAQADVFNRNLPAGKLEMARLELEDLTVTVKDEGTKRFTTVLRKFVPGYEDGTNRSPNPPASS